MSDPEPYHARRIGYLAKHLPLLESAIEAGESPGEALLAKLPRDREGNLRPGSVPAFVDAVEAGKTPDAALVLALIRERRILGRAVQHFADWFYQAKHEQGVAHEALQALNRVLKKPWRP